MTKEYDFASFDIADHNFEFANMTQNEIEKKKAEWEASQKAKVTAASATQPTTPVASGALKPVFKPRITPPPPPEKAE